MTYEEAQKIMSEWSAKMVVKWDKTGLLENIKSDLEKTNMAVLLAPQEKKILIDELSEEEKRLHEAMDIVLNRKKDGQSTPPQEKHRS